jgi:hypothetical protein
VHLRFVFAVLSLAYAAQDLRAQDAVKQESGWEFGVRYWWSRGSTQWNHDASGASPFFGNPTSVLVYDRLNAHSVEAHAARRWRSRWFASGSIGGGTIYGGNLNDSDYFAGQVKFSETNSSVTDGDLAFLTLDVGYDPFRSAAGSALGIFGGFNYWNEKVVASGASFVVPEGATGVPSNIPVITNEMKWYSIRAGLNGRLQLTEKARFTASVALVPRTWLRNNDSHHLRSDLGPTPNIRMEGTGRGVQLDAEARYALYKSVELGLGLRYWRLRADGEIRFAGGQPLPLNEFESKRYGATLSLTSRW